MLQSKLAFKVEEINRRSLDANAAQSESVSIEEEKKQTDPEDVEQECIADDLADEDINPHFQEPLFVGMICTTSNSETDHGGYYRWILFVSSSHTEIQLPKSVASVTYTLHPTFKSAIRVRKYPPFFLDMQGWGVTVLRIGIRFKHDFVRSNLELNHMLSIDHSTTVTDVSDGSRTHFNEIFDFRKFKPFCDEVVAKKPSFVRKVKHRLKQNLLRTPAPLYFNDFYSTLPLFKSNLQKCLREVYQLDVPESIYHLIALFAVLHVPIQDVLPNQEVYIEDCRHSQITISAAKFNHLRLRRCHDVHISFRYILSKCELIECTNVTVECTENCYTYRFDACNHIDVSFLDPGSRISFLCFDSPNITLSCNGIRWKDDDAPLPSGSDDAAAADKYPACLQYEVPYDQGDKSRVSVRWRHSGGVGYTW
eukprot:CAMPEP_0202730792 /NCGR_PEP_ID=MMETSP1385-20130828/186818_1 /ASSEMBLY_ACC=CAM_ASM_000861 /TAXON_ID=933848 /ORGANISM="Elphidium margaritaceum" /LENGTH=422 /DNA_ID=CAMNT_0049397071 /DNA_START=39 /DNA_END=1304 /DNA_ORIENTATION=+